jgi:hypothetical protein
MKSGRKLWSPLARYATKRLRREWLGYTDRDLATLVAELQGERTVISFGKLPDGVVRARRRRTASNGSAAPPKAGA